MASNGNRFGHGDRLHPRSSPAIRRTRTPTATASPTARTRCRCGPGRAVHPHARWQGSSSSTNYVGFTDTPDDLDFGVELSYVPDKWDERGRQGHSRRALCDLSTGARAGVAPEQREAKLMLDLENNGWFAGDDNYRIDGRRGQDHLDCRQNFAASAIEWPHDDDKSIDVAKVAFEAVAPREAPSPRARS